MTAAPAIAQDFRPDRSLVQAYLHRRGEREFRSLYRRHGTALYRFAVLRVGVDAAEEVVQETWIRAARQLPEFRWGSSLRSWLTGITLNCCREALRRRKRERGLEIAPPVASPGAETRLDLARAVSKLPEGAREVLLLHDVEGFTHAEIGRLLGIEIGTAKSQLSRARAAVRRALDSTGEQRHG